MITAVEPEVSNRLRLSFSVIVEPDGGEFYAHIPAFKGIHVDGKTEQEALNRAIEAAHCYLNSMVQRNEPLPVCADLVVARESASKPRPRIRLKKRFEVQWPSLQTHGTR